MDPSPPLSVVVPVYNEADNVQPLATEIHRALGTQAGLTFEIVYVDDGSTDATADTLEALRRELPELRIVRHVGNCGQSAALRTGVRAARYPVIATLDGDGQNDPADVPRLFRAFVDGEADLIAGHRNKRRDTWLRRVSSRVANGVRSRIVGDRTPDTGCGLKVFARDAFLALPFFDHMHRFLPALFIRDGARVKSVPVNHRPRTRGVSKYGVGNRLWVGIVDIMGVVWLQRRAATPVVVENDAADAQRP
jgi:dolichol-phosphate mannosyltransferase